jgi:putative transposase
MNLAPESLYHLYNRGNNKQVIFPQERNYSYFLTKAHHEFKAEIDFLAYCMMPNHFHFLIFTKPEYNSAKFTNALRTLFKLLYTGNQQTTEYHGISFPTKYKINRNLF